MLSHVVGVREHDPQRAGEPLMLVNDDAVVHLRDDLADELGAVDRFRPRLDGC